MRSFSFIIVLVFISCQNREKINPFASEEAEINSIIRTIIYNDSLPILKNTDSTSLCSELNKLEIRIGKYPKPGEIVTVSLDKNKVDVQNLLFDKKRFFSENDSLFLLSQNKGLKTFNIDKNSFDKVQMITRKEIKSSKRNSLRYYEISIPIFSKDNTKAYVEVNKHILSFGSGYIVYLEKVNGKWKIISERMTWIT
ncbi:hypothetical protein ACM55K_12160 [Flavobacterium sp. LT1R49]|uniref:hypothetical protein n=1 Tax=Flavobacterium arabinosi TaxID=3398737 RepID=UPI003A8C7421